MLDETILKISHKEEIKLCSDNIFPNNYLGGPWSGHIPFALDLVKNIQPKLLVELGTYYGESYFAFCQALQLWCKNSMAYAIDTWKGDKHGGFYGDEVFQKVSTYNDTNYCQFSYLMRNTFDNAGSNFADESIDLLHIDGLHTYDAVKHDFSTWLPKVKAGGIILFHDTAIRHKDFGVWKLWNEIKRKFDHTFTFNHSAGLGVLRKPTAKLLELPFLKKLFEDDQDNLDRLRHHYIKCWKTIELSKLQYEKSALENEKSVLEQKLCALQAQYDNIVQSKSWNITKPLRWGVRKIRR